MNNWKVYKHSSPNGFVYIGITHYDDLDMRWKNGHGYPHNPHFTNAILKYGWDNFTHEIVEDGLSCEEAKKLEIILISKYKRFGKCYNITDGGDGHNGQIMSEETEQKISQTLKETHPEPWNKGKTGIYSEETLQRISKGCKGRVSWNKGIKTGELSESHRQKISGSLKGKNTWSKGKKLGAMSDKVRLKHSKAMIGKNKGIKLGERPDDVKMKISEGHKGQKWICKPWEQPRQISRELVDEYINNGWQLGKQLHLDDHIYKWSKVESKWIIIK